MGAGGGALQNDAVNEAAKPRFHRGKPGGIGVLMIHGLTASPTEVAPLFEYLSSRHPEWSLSSPLLPGHGTTVQDLLRVGCDQWIETVEAEVDRLAQTSSSVSVVGVSMGAVLVACHAAGDPRIRCVSMLAPVFRLKPAVNALLPLLRLVMTYKKKNRASIRNHREKGLFSYDRYPIAALIELRDLGRRTWARLHQLRIPVLIAAGLQDPYLSWSEMDRIARRIGGDRVELLPCPRSGHILPHEPDAPGLFSAVENLIVHGAE
jgi:carboxylesterase